MNKILYILSSIFLIFSYLPLAAQTHSAYFKYLPPITATTPDWAKYMYSEQPNLLQLEEMYLAYYENHSFEKNIHTQNYKHLRRCLRQNHYVLADGSLTIPTLSVADSLAENWGKQWKKLKQRPDVANWQTLGPLETKFANEGISQAAWQANVYCLEVAPSNANVLYCGTETGAIFTTVDKGLNWTCISQELSLGGVGCIAVNPLNEKVLYVGEGAKVYKSIDGGEHWEVMLNVIGLNPTVISIHAIDTSIVLVGGSKLYRSENGGIEWNTLYSQQIWDIKHQPNNADVVYLLKNNPSQKIAEFWKSTNKGETWARMSAGW
ncbi:MAG: WD40/YVTN/BNR-like repeat-containing protein, partial [Bacteroidia bacterium]